MKPTKLFMVTAKDYWTEDGKKTPAIVTTHKLSEAKKFAESWVKLGLKDIQILESALDWTATDGK